MLHQKQGANDKRGYDVIEILHSKAIMPAFELHLNAGDTRSSYVPTQQLGYTQNTGFTTNNFTLMEKQTVFYKCHNFLEGIVGLLTKSKPRNSLVDHTKVFELL